MTFFQLNIVTLSIHAECAQVLGLTGSESAICGPPISRQVTTLVSARQYEL